MKYPSMQHILALAVALACYTTPHTLSAPHHKKHMKAQIYIGNTFKEKAFRQLPVLEQAAQEASKILATFPSKEAQEQLSGKAITDLLEHAHKINLEIKDVAAEQALMELAKTNGITNLKTLRTKLLDQHSLNAAINRWIKAYEWNRVAKNPAFIQMAQELKKRLTTTTPQDEALAQELYNIMFKLFAAQTIEALKKTIAPDVLEKFNYNPFYALVKKYSELMQLHEESEFKICASIYAEPLICSLGIIDPETAQTILEPLYKNAPMKDIKSLLKGLARLNKEKTGQRYTVADQKILSVPFAAQALNRMLHAPIKSMQKQTTRALHYTLSNLMHGISVINETINLSTQNVGPYKKVSDELEAKLQQTMQECAQLTKTFNAAIQSLKPPKPEAQEATPMPQSNNPAELQPGLARIIQGAQTNPDPGFGRAVPDPTPMPAPAVNPPPAAPAPAPEIQQPAPMPTPEVNPAPAPMPAPTPPAPAAV